MSTATSCDQSEVLQAGKLVGGMEYMGTTVSVIRADETERVIIFANGRMVETRRWFYARLSDENQLYTLAELCGFERDGVMPPIGIWPPKAKQQYLKLPTTPGAIALARALKFTDPFDWVRTCPECESSDFRYRGPHHCSPNIAGPAAGDSWVEEGYWLCFGCGWAPKRVPGPANLPLVYPAELFTAASR